MVLYRFSSFIILSVYRLSFLLLAIVLPRPMIPKFLNSVIPPACPSPTP